MRPGDRLRCSGGGKHPRVGGIGGLYPAVTEKVWVDTRPGAVWWMALLRSQSEPGGLFVSRAPREPTGQDQPQAGSALSQHVVWATAVVTEMLV